jgi:hypothetical protein
MERGRSRGALEKSGSVQRMDRVSEEIKPAAKTFRIRKVTQPNANQRMKQPRLPSITPIAICVTELELLMLAPLN